MKKIYTLLSLVILTISVKAQQVVLFTDSMTANSNWQLNVSSGPNSSMPDTWVLNDMEGGVAPGGCQQMMNGDLTLHVTMPQAISGATYSPQKVTHMRAQMNQGISTIGISPLLMLTFDYVAGGNSGMDYSSILYSIDGGTTFVSVSNINSTGICTGGRTWSTAVVMLPSTCNNISDLRIGFNWTGNGDGFGTNPSIAINNLKISYQNTTTGINENEITSANIFSDGSSITVNSNNDFKVISVTNISGQSLSFEKENNKIILKNTFEGILFVAIEANGTIIRKKLLF